MAPPTYSLSVPTTLRNIIVNIATIERSILDTDSPALANSNDLNFSQKTQLLRLTTQSTTPLITNNLLIIIYIITILPTNEQSTKGDNIRMNTTATLPAEQDTTISKSRIFNETEYDTQSFRATRIFNELFPAVHHYPSYLYENNQFLTQNQGDL
jgi:hypothetical protein